VLLNLLLSVEDLYLDLSLIHQLHLTAIWRIEKRLNLVANDRRIAFAGRSFAAPRFD
jgi:hypothetical protein